MGSDEIPPPPTPPVHPALTQSFNPKPPFPIGPVGPGGLTNRAFFKALNWSRFDLAVPGTPRHELSVFEAEQYVIPIDTPRHTYS